MNAGLCKIEKTVGMICMLCHIKAAAKPIFDLQRQEG